MENQFLFGAVYIIEQDYTEEEIRRDLKNMKDCGFNLVTLWPVANPWLAKSSHEWVFDRTRLVLDCCQELGMKAIMQLFGQNQAQEFMPDSAMTREMEYTDQYGPWYNTNCFWANLNHPVVREYFDRYFRAAITALKDHPAIYGWDVFNEAHNRSDDEWFIGKYQDWLKEKYGTIEKLNKEWYRRYESFAQIRPETRRAPYSIWSSLLPSVEYEKFRSVNVTEICDFLCGTAKKYDSEHPILVDGTSSAIVSADITMRNNDEFDTAYVTDIYGATFYPKSWGRNYKDTPWTLSMYFTIPSEAARLAGKPYFVNELQTHTQSILTPGSEVSCQELESWTLMCIFTGAAGMQLWRWRPFLHGYQSTGRGLTLMDGTPNERAEVMKKMMTMIHGNEALFAKSKKVEPTVAIACNYDIRVFFDSLLKFGDAGKSFYGKNMEGWYKLFWNWGIPTGYADLARFQGEEKQPPVLVLPGAVRVSQEEAENLRVYVERGGILIADGRMGALNEWGCVPAEGIPGKTLSRLFGVVEIDTGCERSMCLEGQELPTGFQYQRLKLTDPDTAVLARMEDGSPAVVCHSYGKGKAMYFNNFEGLVLLERLYPQLQRLVWDVVAPAVALHAEKNEQVQLSYMEAERRRLILAVNFADTEEDVTLYGLEPGRGLRELYTGARVTAEESCRFRLRPNSTNVFLED